MGVEWGDKSQKDLGYPESLEVPRVLTLAMGQAGSARWFWSNLGQLPFPCLLVSHQEGLVLGHELLVGRELAPQLSLEAVACGSCAGFRPAFPALF